MRQKVSSRLTVMRARITVQLIVVCASISMGFGVGRAVENVTEPVMLMADVDGDGRLGVISRRRSGAAIETGAFLQTVVIDAFDTVLGTSLDILDPIHLLAFGERHFGISLPQLGGDVDRGTPVMVSDPTGQWRALEYAFHNLQGEMVQVSVEAIWMNGPNCVYDVQSRKMNERGER